MTLGELFGEKLREGRFLGWLAGSLEYYEQLFREDLGVWKGRRGRAFIGFEQEGDKVVIVFLTTSPDKHNKREVNLKEHCYIRCSFIKPVAHLHRNRNTQSYRGYVIYKELLKEEDYQVCGFCKDLESILNMVEKIEISKT